MFLAVTPPDTNTVDNVALLGLISKTTSLVRARGTRSPVNDVQLAILPAATNCSFSQCKYPAFFEYRNAPNTEKETKDI